MQSVNPHHVVVKDFFRATSWAEGVQPGQTPTTKTRAGLFSPGVPGVGKSTAAIQYLARNDGRLLSPSTALAGEQKKRAQNLAHARNTDKQRPKQIKGLGRGCGFGPDVWSGRGRMYAAVMCTSCPQTTTCTAHTQHYETPQEVYGVHPQMNWAMPNKKLTDRQRKIRSLRRKLGRAQDDQPKALIIDEMPTPITTVALRREDFEVGRCIYPELWAWMKATTPSIREFFDAWEEVRFHLAYHPEMKWGMALDLAALMPPGSRFRVAAESLHAVLVGNPVPTPDAEQARMGLVLPERWPHADCVEFLRVLLQYELPNVPREDRGVGAPSVALRVRGGDNEGRYLPGDETFELLRCWVPPTVAHIILDSTAPYAEKIYAALYDQTTHDVRSFYRETPLPKDGSIRAIHCATPGFSYSRCFKNAKELAPEGENVTVRALQRLVLAVDEDQLRFNGDVQPNYRIGLITHRRWLKCLGWQFDADDKLLRDEGGLTVRAPLVAVSPKLAAIEKLLRTLESRGCLVVGYHGAVKGSNLWEYCAVMGHLDAPKINIGTLKTEAKGLGLDADEYSDTRHTVEAVQEIFRCRPLSATPKTPRTILWFAKARSAGDFAWETETWAEGGRVPGMETATAQRLARLQATRFGAMASTLVGVVTTGELNPLTPIKTPLQELSRLFPDGMTPTFFEMYRREVREIALARGWRLFKHPTDPGHPKVWATDEATAARWRASTPTTPEVVLEGYVLSVDAAERKIQAFVEDALAENAAQSEDGEQISLADLISEVEYVGLAPAESPLAWYATRPLIRDRYRPRILRQ